VRAVRRDGVTVVRADEPAGLLYGLFHVVRLGESAFGADRPAEAHRPALERRMLDHWDNVDVHPVMGQVERGYSGGSIFWRDGDLREDLSRVRAYARLLAACGVNAVTVNNVNVHATETRLLTDRLGDIATIAGLLRPYGIRVHLSVSFAAPVTVGGLPTADPLDEAVRRWWAATTRRVYETIPDFGGYVVTADSEGQPGPLTYGRSHADGANLLAEALAPHGGVVRWRAFVYNHRQDWRDRSTDRARAAFDHFAPLDGQFRDNAILQVKYGPMDFQTREPVSPVIAAMPCTVPILESRVVSRRFVVVVRRLSVLIDDAPTTRFRRTRASTATTAPGSWSGGVLIQALMWTVSDEVALVLTQDAAGVPLVVDQDPVGAFGPDAADEAFRITVRPGTPWRSLDHLNAVGGKHRVEGPGELSRPGHRPGTESR
jgi:alpha-glucuronidase